MKSLRRSFPAVAGLLLAGVVVVSGITPALAAPPFPVGAQATALVGGTPLVQATCPTAAPQPPATGNSTAGPVFVTGGGARCTGNGASADGQYSITGATAPPPTSLRFSSQCVNATGTTGGLVDVPAGTNVSGGVGVVGVQTAVTTLNTMVTYPGGTTAILNQVTTTATSVTRNAIVITSGPAAGTVVGQSICGSPIAYPLAVDAPAAGAPADLALTASTGDSSSNRWLFVGGAVALLVLAQVAVGRTVWRRRQGVTGA